MFYVDQLLKVSSCDSEINTVMNKKWIVLPILFFGVFVFVGTVHEKHAPPVQIKEAEKSDLHFAKVIEQANEMGRHLLVAHQDSRAFDAWLYAVLVFAEYKAVFAKANPHVTQDFIEQDLDSLWRQFSLAWTNFRYNSAQYQCVKKLFAGLRWNGLVVYSVRNAMSEQKSFCNYDRTKLKAVQFVKDSIEKKAVLASAVKQAKDNLKPSLQMATVAEVIHNFKSNANDRHFLSSATQLAKNRRIAAVPSSISDLKRETLARVIPDDLLKKKEAQLLLDSKKDQIYFLYENKAAERTEYFEVSQKLFRYLWSCYEKSSCLVDKKSELYKMAQSMLIFLNLALKFDAKLKTNLDQESFLQLIKKEQGKLQLVGLRTLLAHGVSDAEFRQIVGKARYFRQENSARFFAILSQKTLASNSDRRDLLVTELLKKVRRSDPATILAIGNHFQTFELTREESLRFLGSVCYVKRSRTKKNIWPQLVQSLQQGLRSKFLQKEIPSFCQS